MEVCRTMGLVWSGPAALWGVSFLRRHSVPFVEIWLSSILECGLDWKDRSFPESCKSCKVLWARAFSDRGDLGLNQIETVRAFALSGSEESVFPFAFKDDMPLESCLECLSREYSFLVLTFGGVSKSSVSWFKPSISPMYFSYALSDTRRTRCL